VKTMPRAHLRVWGVDDRWMGAGGRKRTPHTRLKSMGGGWGLDGSRWAKTKALHSFEERGGGVGYVGDVGGRGWGGWPYASTPARVWWEMESEGVLVKDTGNPWVFLAIPVPVPTKTHTRH
jgi:hypothetical protein